VAEAVTTNPSPLGRSPVRPRPPLREHAGWEVSAVSSSAALRLIDLTPLGKVRVRAELGSPAAAALACAFGSARREGMSLVIGSGPDEWLLLSPAGRRPPLLESIPASDGRDPAAGGLVSVVDVTHAGVLLRLTGADAAELLSRVCAVNLSDKTAPSGSAFRSSVARIVCDVVRDDVDGLRSYLLHGDRSSGQYLFDSLLEVGREFGIDVDGYPEEEI
jgi:heterotetrameric sarcosine oxidase gamma subunit